MLHGNEAGPWASSASRTPKIYSAVQHALLRALGTGVVEPGDQEFDALGVAARP